MKQEKCLLYFKNGDTYLGNHYTRKECVDKLHSAGYKQYYTGRKHTGICDEGHPPVFVGIDENNTVGLKQRRENGLAGAVCMFL